MMAGVGGGVLLTLLLAYPLYVKLPFWIFEAPSYRQDNIPVICYGLSVIVLLITGVAGGRWSGLSQSYAFLGGSAAGVIAAVICYALIISPATGVLGNKSIFQFGLKKVLDDISLSWLVLYGVSETLWWGVIALFVSIGIGASLGHWVAGFLNLFLTPRKLGNTFFHLLTP
jgi:hypothetical protein